MLIKLYSLVFLLVATSALTGCSGGKSRSRNLFPAEQYKVTPQNFISGKRFCELYDKVGGQEFGRYVSVPKDYSNPSKGTIEVYAYSYKPFNPQLPTYIFVDGGPGQNTHGFKGVLNGEANELKFDQRGLGCSTPQTFEEYFDATLYSTENTARDMDEIRKAYGIAKWSVYGISYGTQPATVYSSKFSDHLTSVVLEGVTSFPQMAHAGKYKAEKWNLVLSTLTTTQRNAFRDLVYEEDSNGSSTADSETIWDIFSESSFMDNGLQKVSNFLLRLINADGSLNRSLLEKYRSEKSASRKRYPTTQRPSAVDRNVMLMIDCKEFSHRTIASGNVSYSYNSGFVESDPVRALVAANQRCDEVKARTSDQTPYLISNYPIQKPVYYFQGSHDGATMAVGAFEHWKTVPKGQATFLLAKLGGHNPSLVRIRKAETKSAQQNLFLRAINAQQISEEHVQSVNGVLPDQFDWVLFVNGFTSDALRYLEGM